MDNLLLFSLQEAARYLGGCVADLEWACKIKDLEPTWISGEPYFERADLDHYAYRANVRRAVMFLDRYRLFESAKSSKKGANRGV